MKSYLALSTKDMFALHATSSEVGLIFSSCSPLMAAIMAIAPAWSDYSALHLSSPIKCVISILSIQLPLEPNFQCRCPTARLIFCPPKLCIVCVAASLTSNFFSTGSAHSGSQVLPVWFHFIDSDFIGCGFSASSFCNGFGTGEFLEYICYSVQYYMSCLHCFRLHIQLVQFCFNFLIVC